MRVFPIIFLLIATNVFSQDLNESTNSFFDDSVTKEFTLTTILLEGEVENPGDVDLTSLPIHEIIVKEAMQDEEGNTKFVGSYHCSGYSLFDIVNQKTLMKGNKKDFKPFVDLYVVIENNAGNKVVVSWGELYYTKNIHSIILSKSVSSIRPSKINKVWPMPETPRMIFSNDLFNDRFIDNPVKISVVSHKGDFPKEKNLYTEEISLFVDGKEIGQIEEISSGNNFKNIEVVDYGHGMGFKGIQTIEGAPLKFEIAKILNENELSPNLQNRLVIISAKDSYRVVYSLSEIMNRNNGDEFLLIEKEDDPKAGKFRLYSLPDFFVDRCVRSISKIEIIDIK